MLIYRNVTCQLLFLIVPDLKKIKIWFIFLKKKHKKYNVKILLTSFASNKLYFVSESFMFPF